MPTVDGVLEVGLGSALKSKDISVLCNLHERDVRLVIRELIKDGLPVASSTDGLHGGFYITATRAEADAYIADMRSRIVEIALRMRDYKRAARSILNPGQLALL